MHNTENMKYHNTPTSSFLHSVKDYHPQVDAVNLNKTAMESELLGARLTEEIRRLRAELNECKQQRHDATRQLQGRSVELQAALTRNQELQTTLEKIRHDTVRGALDCTVLPLLVV